MSEKEKEEMSRCTVTLQRVLSVDSLSGYKTPIMSVSESDSDASLVTVSSGVTSKSKRRRSVTEDGSDDDAPVAKVTPARRGRGRPPTTGQYVGLAKAQSTYNDGLREQLRLEAEKELSDEMKLRRSDFLKVSGDGEAAEQVEGRTVADMEKMLLSSMAKVETVAKKSSHLKGTYVRDLKEAARISKACFQELRTRTQTEEMRLLVETNTRMSTELEVLRREMEELRKLRVQPQQPAATVTQPTEDVVRAVMVQVGTMLNARLAGLEERLLPEKRLRPPLAADLRREAAARTASMEEYPPLPAPRVPAKPKGVPKKGSSVAPATQPAEGRQPVPEEAWTLVEKKGSRRSTKKRSDVPAHSAPKTAAPAKPRPAPPAKKQAKKKARRLRPPRTAAVAITLQPEATEKGVTYAEVLAEAKARIDLQALGMSSGIKMRTAATGAKIIEVPGANKAELADSLAAKLREVFKESEEVKISRPVTMADLRVSGLDESVDTTELTEAVAKAGGCSPEAIKTGLIRRGAAGMGTCVLRCPVTAANQIMARGRILVGWVSVQVRLLEARPRRCFRCLVLGHVRVQCNSEVDRSDECYRCGQNGHKANGCSAAPHCTLCAAVGKPAEHLSGGKACAKPPAKKARGARAATEATAKSQPSRPPREQPVCMEES